jgi:hypothetical protein
LQVGNVASWTVNDWKSNILLASQAHIDAFALNMAAGYSGNAAQVANAFEAVVSAGSTFSSSFLSTMLATGAGP